MKVRANSNDVSPRFLTRMPLLGRTKAEQEEIWAVADAPIPHPELDLNDFWAFQGATE